MRRHAIAAALFAAVLVGCSAHDEGDETSQVPAPHETTVDTRVERVTDCGPAGNAIGPCVLRPAPGDLNVWTIHDAAGRQIGVSAA